MTTTAAGRLDCTASARRQASIWAASSLAGMATTAAALLTKGHKRRSDGKLRRSDGHACVMGPRATSDAVVREGLQLARDSHLGWRKEATSLVWGAHLPPPPVIDFNRSRRMRQHSPAAAIRTSARRTTGGTGPKHGRSGSGTAPRDGCDSGTPAGAARRPRRRSRGACGRRPRGRYGAPGRARMVAVPRAGHRRPRLRPPLAVRSRRASAATCRG